MYTGTWFGLFQSANNLITFYWEIIVPIFVPIVSGI